MSEVLARFVPHRGKLVATFLGLVMFMAAAVYVMVAIGPEELRKGSGFGRLVLWVVLLGCPVFAADVLARIVRRTPLGLRTRLAKRPEWVAPTLAWLLSLDEASFLHASRNTAIRRSGWRGLLRNALIAAGNSRDPALLPLVRKFLEDDDAMLREHAGWALEALEAGGPTKSRTRDSDA